MDGKMNNKGLPMSGDYMEKLFEKCPRFQFKQHLIAVGFIFGATMTCMYLMSKNIDQTMPWRGKKNN